MDNLPSTSVKPSQTYDPESTVGKNEMLNGEATLKTIIKTEPGEEGHVVLQPCLYNAWKAAEKQYFDSINAETVQLQQLLDAQRNFRIENAYVLILNLKFIII